MSSRFVAETNVKMSRFIKPSIIKTRDFKIFLKLGIDFQFTIC